MFFGAVAGSAVEAGAEQSLRYAQARFCDWYIILGCSRRAEDVRATLDSFGGPGVGGPAGAKVIKTDRYPNFRDGWFCIVDGPYASREEAGSIAWTEAVPDAYLKRGC